MGLGTAITPIRESSRRLLTIEPRAIKVCSSRDRLSEVLQYATNALQQPLQLEEPAQRSVPRMEEAAAPPSMM